MTIQRCSLPYRSVRWRWFSAAVLLAAHGSVCRGAESTAPVAWPEATQSARPWTRWWWHGSAVDEQNLSRLLQDYNRVGLGGVEITCIYGVQGAEDRNREYLSREWKEAIDHTLNEARRLGMGVDLPAGSGWRMGGPDVEMADANKRAILQQHAVDGGTMFHQQFEAVLQAAIAVEQQGQRVDLLPNLQDGEITWQAPPGDWKIYILGYRWAGDRVKRPGPGGAGLNINPFSKLSVSKFLAHFGDELSGLQGIRAQFHDSFEYGGDWQPDFLEEFAARRGYRLEEYLPALAGDGARDLVERVKCDYRETLADLVREDLVETWARWAHDHGQLARNQSHGSPANWLDLYAACDIPETESFGRLQGGDADPLVLKFASSAANVAGKQLVSAETATWLDEHFHVTLAQIKQILDRQMLAGVNHAFYHGTAYSPADVAWPGWLFYASTQLNPQNPIWRDLPALNEYVRRCQSVLQASKPDNDVLLYWPIHDTWHEASGMRKEFRVHDADHWLYGWPIGEAAKLLQENAYSFDYVSDRGLASCHASDKGRLVAPGGEYAAVVVPRAQHMPLETLTALADFADAGVKVVFWGDLPHSQPGMAGATASAAWNETTARMRQSIEAGRATRADDLPAALGAAEIRNERNLQQSGLSFLRKRWDDDVVYLLQNHGERTFRDWTSPAVELADAIIMDPVSGRIGRAPARQRESAAAEVFLELAPGETLLLLASERPLQAEPWSYRAVAGSPTQIPGPWHVAFVAGGPALPAEFTTDEPGPWTEAPDQDAERFAGTARYSARFDRPSAEDQRWLLDLGNVLGSARVKLNGEQIGMRFAPPYVVQLPELKPVDNLLEIEVTGVAANRIRDLDRRGVKWRVFEDINLVNIDYKRFDASGWPVRPQGLTGPVSLVPLASNHSDSASR